MKSVNHHIYSVIFPVMLALQEYGSTLVTDAMEWLPDY